MQEDFEQRIFLEARYIIENNATVRATGKVFHLGKSTVHKDVTERLERLDYELFLEVKAVLQKNLSERHIRGGLATKRKYKNLKNTSV